MADEGRLSFWGWGREGAGPDEAARHKIAAGLAARFGRHDLAPAPYPRIEEIALRAPRVQPPSALRELCSEDPWERARHHYGRSYRDVVRGLRREFPHPPDQVAFPRNAADVAALLDWCASARIAAIPFGGGSSVVGGVELADESGYAGFVSIDLSRMGRVLEVDRASRAARIEAGVYGPALEEQLRPHGLTLRYFPQSFEFSTLGGWIATRGGGHYATRLTHIDDLVESVTAVTPSGVMSSRRLPGSGAGPSPDRLWLGSEGIFGVITEAWMRLQDRPGFRASASVGFEDFARGAEAVRMLAQSGLDPSNCRLLDPAEAQNMAGASGSEAVLMLGFESADHALDAKMARAVELCRDCGGQVPDDAVRTRTDAGATREGRTGAWRNAFISAPYSRDALASMSVITETFETAICWNDFADFHAGVTEATRDVLERVCGGGTVTCRFTHVYPDGPAPYFTVMAAGRRGSELEQWAEIKQAASEALLRLGGTITHHHAIGRDHRPWYDRQRPDAHARALRAVKAELDPAGILNPGVLIDPQVVG